MPPSRPAAAAAAAADPRSLATIRRRILAWYDAAHRDFPWRGTTDPYAVLVSEVMLQQTQAGRIAERFPRFLARFPTAADLAAARPADVLDAWSGLGYNRRALALRAAAVAVTAHGWPPDVAGLERLPGIGPYTARAVASLAFGRPEGVVDTNVRRWLIRRLAVRDTPRDLQATADALAAAPPRGRSADWTHASMEFGAGICRARRPRCDACPVALGCPSRGMAAAVPVARQAALRGSDRAYRGAIVRLLSGAPGHALPAATVRAMLASDADRIGPALDDAGWRRVLDALERDGLVHRAARELRLGAATIGT
jgi:A/G-specific adenine glycosylase